MPKNGPPTPPLTEKFALSEQPCPQDLSLKKLVERESPGNEVAE